MKVKSLSRVRLLATPWTAAHQAPPSMGFSRQEYWSGCQHVVFRYYNKENSQLKKDMGYVCMFMCVFYFKKTLKSFMLHEGAFGDNAKMDTLTFFFGYVA